MRIKRIIEYLYDKQTNEKTRHILYIEKKGGMEWGFFINLL